MDLRYDDDPIILAQGSGSGNTAVYPHEAYYGQKVIGNILELTVAPHHREERLGRILDYLFTVPELRLLPRAGIFLVDPYAEKLVLIVHRGFSKRQVASCSEVAFGTCRCGEAAQIGHNRFFRYDKNISCGTSCGLKVEHCHLCLPIIRDSLLVGIVGFYLAGQEGLDHGAEELLGSVCHIIGGVLESEEMDLQLIGLVKDLQGSITSLREEKRFSESIIQGLNQGILVVDLKGSILMSNTIAASVLRPFARVLDGGNIFDIVGRDAAEKMMCRNSNLVSGEEISLKTGDGETRVINCSSVRRDDARGRQIGLIISLTDISEISYVRKEMEKMNRLSTVAEIAAAVAHEVRNPLAGIKIMAQSIEEQSITIEEQRECSRRIVRQVDRLNELLTEFFSYARPVTPKPKQVAIIDVLSETRHLVDNKLMNKNIAFIQRHQPNLPPIFADPNQLQQVFLNLFLNAVDAVAPGGVITVKINELEGPDLRRYKRKYPGLLTGSHYVRLLFTDNGKGMSSATAEKVFEPFFTTKTTGSGLGLSIVYRTLKENHAAILVDSVEGQTTTFTLFFKVVEGGE